ncbi:glycosyltransferase [Azospirillum formosense]|nr:glycosyltransferase [Azospirillum formosense]MBY3757670.1 glycosyltransferase [Azospirillum formosense]
MTMGSHFGLDDWYDPQVGDVAAGLHRRWNYQAVIVNYVWFSGVLESLPSNLIKIIDTHDVFGDRHLRSIAAGLKPEWYYTSQQEELRGLQRADIVLAIQNEEKKYFEELGLSKVEVVGFVTPPNFLPLRPNQRKMTIGYIASSNPWNVNSFLYLHAALEKRPELVKKFNFEVAGPICNVIKNENTIFNASGILDSVSNFYRNVDIVVNPMLGGTGLKIKSIEALSFGRPFFSTADGMVGIPSLYTQHNASSIEMLVDHMQNINENTTRRLSAESREIFSAYQRHQMINFKNVIQGI